MTALQTTIAIAAVIVQWIGIAVLLWIRKSFGAYADQLDRTYQGILDVEADKLDERDQDRQLRAEMRAEIERLRNVPPQMPYSTYTERKEIA